MTEESVTDQDDLPIREGSDLPAFLLVLKRAHAELAGEVEANAVFARLSAVSTRRRAMEYFAEMMPQLLQERENRRKKRLGVT